MENKNYCNDVAATANTETSEGPDHTFNLTPADAETQKIAEKMPTTDNEHRSAMDADIEEIVVNDLDVDKDTSTLPRLDLKQETEGLRMTGCNSKPEKALRKRNTRTVLEKIDERKSILADLAEGKNPREIRHRLNLTKDQYGRYIIAALDAGELNQQPKDVAYAVIRFGAWPTDDRSEFRKRLKLNLPDSALLKFENRDGNKIICSIIDAEDISEEGDEKNDSNK